LAADPIALPLPTSATDDETAPDLR